MFCCWLCMVGALCVGVDCGWFAWIDCWGLVFCGLLGLLGLLDVVVFAW